MLVLTRQTDERILIEVREVLGNQVKIGIEAPPWMPVLRQDLVEQESPNTACAACG